MDEFLAEGDACCRDYSRRDSPTYASESAVAFTHLWDILYAAKSVQFSNRRFIENINTNKNSKDISFEEIVYRFYDPRHVWGF
jgi:hypothetical protein